MARSRIVRRCHNCGAVVVATIEASILKTLTNQLPSATNPQLARRLKLSVDSVRRATRQLVIQKRVRILSYARPYRYGLRRG